jgi:hypothetical protein
MAIQTTGETFEGAASVDAPAPAVRFEPCAELRLAHDSPWGVCDACGWLDDDHTRPDEPGAVVTELPRRAAPLFERKAS